MKWFISLLLSASAFAATSKEPANCSSRPCTYTVTCAAALCTSTEVQEVQDAINDAQLGDTIKLEAGRTFSVDSAHLLITARPGSAGYLTIRTTTDDSQLPDENTRITPAYAALLPKLETTVTNKAAMALSGDAHPAEHIQFIGIWFSVNPVSLTTSYTRGPLLIGNSGSVDDFGGFIPDGPEDQPNDIVVDRCLFLHGWLATVRRMISLHGRAVTIKNSYIDGALDLTDSQSISGWNGVGPYTIENNYVGGATENIMFGGTKPAFDGEVDSATIRFNYFPHVEERMRYRAWSAGLYVFKGLIIRPSVSNGYTYIATNSGQTGGSEPSWPTSGDVVDGGVTWRMYLAGTGHRLVKNNFELKAAKNVLLQYNVFDTMWGDGQEYILNLKAENQPFSCSDNFPACYKARTTNITVANNVLRNGFSAIAINACTAGTCAAVGPYDIHDNLIYGMDYGRWGGGWATTGYLLMWDSGVASPSSYDHNTNDVDGSQLRSQFYGHGTTSGMHTWRNNIGVRKDVWGIRGDGQGEGTPTIQGYICNGAVTTACYAANVFVGSDPGSYPAAPATRWAATRDDVGYTDVSTRDYRLRDDSPYLRAGTDGRDIGADIAQLPLIRNLQVSPTDRAVLLTWQLSAPILSIPCVIEVSLDRDLATTVADLDPAVYPRPDTDEHDRSYVDGARRMIAVGLNTPLSPNATYWYRLQCGGDTRTGSFTMLDPLAGTTTIKVSGQASSGTVNRVVAWGKYSRSNDSFSDGGTSEPVACTPPAPCTVSFTANRGDILQYRWRDLDGSGSPVSVGPVISVAVQ
jgi:hypothetical protein